MFFPPFPHCLTSSGKKTCYDEGGGGLITRKRRFIGLLDLTPPVRLYLNRNGVKQRKWAFLTRNNLVSTTVDVFNDHLKWNTGEKIAPNASPSPPRMTSQRITVDCL